MAVRISPDDDLGTPLPYDPDFRGPLKNRSCTDVICLTIFLVFIACWAGIGWYAISHGDPNALLVPKDSKGSRCGLDSHVRNKKYLFFFDLTKCLEPNVPFIGCQTTQVCVEKCPDSVYIKGSGYDSSLAKPFCSTYDPNDCPKWFLPSMEFQRRCIPTPAALANNSTMNEISEFLQDGNLFDKLTKAIINIKLISEAEEFGQNVVEDIMRSWWKIVVGIGLALVACIIYVLILRWVAAFMVWLSIGGVLAGLTAAVYFTAINYKYWNEQYSKYEEVQASNKTKKDWWLTGLIIASVILLIILLVLIFLRKRIVLAIALIKESSRAVSSVTSVLFFPIFPWIFEVGVVAYAVIIGLYLTTTGNPLYMTRNVTIGCSSATGIQDNVKCDSETFIQTTLNISLCDTARCKFIKMEEEVFYPYLQVINVFGFFWLAFFVSAMGQMILAMVFAQWYWTWDKRKLPFFALTAAFWRVLRYHIGTVAFGSLLVAICRIIRVILEYIDRKLKKYDNELTRAIMCMLKCFFWCLEKFIKFINKNAYIMCAIHGKNFCTSAKDAFMLLMRNIIRVFVLDKVTDFLFFISKLMVTIGVGAVAYVCFATDLLAKVIDNSGLKYPEVPVAAIMIVTYLIATMFFSVYSMAVDTLFLCFLEDSERNNGTSEKPYYMSRNLMKILGKKNKMS